MDSPCDGYHVLFRLDRLELPGGVLWLWATGHGMTEFAARDEKGNNRVFPVRENEPTPIPGFPGLFVDVLGCRGKTLGGPGWAVARVVDSCGPSAPAAKVA